MRARTGTLPLLVPFLLVLAACAGPAAEPAATEPTAPVPTLAATATSVPLTATAPAEASAKPPTTQPTTASELLEPGDAFEFKRIDMLDGMRGWAVVSTAGRDHLLRTDDGGASWLDVSPPTAASDNPNGLHLAAAFPTHASAILTYYAPQQAPAALTIWTTQSRGFEWAAAEPVPLDLRGAPLQITLRFDSEQDGLLAAATGEHGGQEFGAQVFHTESGAETWTQVIASECRVTGVDLRSDRAWITQDCGPTEDGAASVPLLRSADGGRTWQDGSLPLAAAGLELPDQALRCHTHSPNLLSSSLGYAALACRTDDAAYASVLQATLKSHDGGMTFSGRESPPGQLLMVSEQDGWRFDREIQRTRDGAERWSLINQVAWQGQFDFLDRWRGWAVASDEQEAALVHSMDGARSFSLLEATLRPPTGTTEASICTLAAEGPVDVFTRPSFAAEPFGGLPGTMDVRVEALTQDGWIAINPGVAQAANIGPFRYRWLPPSSTVNLEGDCDALPIVEAPVPAVCYNMPMDLAPIHEQPDENSPRLITAAPGEFFKILARNSDDWVQVDLNVGNVGLDLQGWMPAQHLNINGPCRELTPSP